MSDLQGAIECLKKSQHYKDIADFADDGLLFNLFEVMGVRYRELTHSSVLAWLLSDEANIDFIREFLNRVAKQDKVEFDDETKGKIANFQTSDDIEVICEYGDEKSRIDVFAHFKSLELVIGIEVKVWAGEQEKQVKRYQKLLKKEYPNDRKIVIFLTPSGYEPSTAIKCEDVPVVCMSWGDIVDIIDKVNDAAEKTREKYEKHIFRKQFSQHIKRNILMGTKEKQLVRKLLSEGENATTIHKIIHNLPPLTDYLDEWKQIVADVCDVENSESELEVKIYPSSRAPARELKIEIKKWNEAKLPFTLMLENYKDAMFRIRLLLWYEFVEPGNNYFNECNDSLKKFERDSNGIVEYVKLKYWGAWYSVLSSRFEEIQETPFNPYKNDWKIEAQNILSQLVKSEESSKTLLQLIENKRQVRLQDG